MKDECGDDAGIQVAPRAGAGIEIAAPALPPPPAPVAPRAGAGIEIWAITPSCICTSVAPRAGAGIEIIWTTCCMDPARSPLAQGRELKLFCRFRRFR